MEIVIGILWFFVLVFVLVMLNRLVKAVERIADACELGIKIKPDDRPKSSI